MAKTRQPAIRESEGCCIVCLGFGNGHTKIPGQTAGLERQLCAACHQQGFSVAQVMEKDCLEPIPVPWTWKLTTPWGQVLDVSTAKPKRIGARRMKKLRAKDTYSDPGLIELHQALLRIQAS